MNKSSFLQNIICLCLPLWMISACTSSSSQTSELPVLGTKKIVNGDTVFHQIPQFEFVNQDSQVVTEQDFKGKIYVTDFFFTSCPTICPKMKQQMLRLYEAFEDEPNLKLLSHSIDPTYDTPEILAKYADKLGVSSDKWDMVTGKTSEIYDMADQYLVSVVQDSTAPGGIIHGGHFILVDGERRIRGYYDGTRPEEVNRLMEDIRKLIPSNDTATM